MTVRRWKIGQNWGEAWVILEVDHDKLSPDLATLINDFWSGADARLADAEEDPVMAVIKLAGSCFLGWVLDTMSDYNTFGMQGEFNSQEGWPPNGAHGIKLVDWDGRPDLDSTLLEISEVLP